VVREAIETSLTTAQNRKGLHFCKPLISWC
jgi:hypothetical protein